MQTRKSKEELREIILSDDSNLNLPEVSYPSSYKLQGEIKYGSKSKERYLASEHELLEYQKRISRKESILSSDEIRNLVSESNERRRALEQSILLQKQEFEQKRVAEIAARR